MSESTMSTILQVKPKITVTELDYKQTSLSAPPQWAFFVH